MAKEEQRMRLERRRRRMLDDALLCCWELSECQSESRSPHGGMTLLSAACFVLPSSARHFQTASPLYLICSILLYTIYIDLQQFISSPFSPCLVVPRKNTRAETYHTMSSHVVVLDATARRATIKTSPGKHLTDILQEACAKLGIDASQYGLK